MSRPGSKFNSYKIRISKIDLNRVLDTRFWPVGIECSKWYEPRYSRYNHPYNIYSETESDSDSEYGDASNIEIDNEVDNNVDNNANDSANTTDNL